ncbi:MAG: MlaA family lipoprotein [Campylobacterota bacterium]
MKKIIFLTLLGFSISSLFADDFSDFNEEFKTKKQKDIFDPLSGYNKAMTSFNDFVIINAVNPVADGYSYILPEPMRVGVSNFFTNLAFPIRFVNNILQLKLKEASVELASFTVNTIWGIGGILTPAQDELKLQRYDEDFGQTLGHYGVGSGFHIVLPFLGPSNLRDMISIVPDSYIGATSTTGQSDIGYKIPNNQAQSFGISTYNRVNKVSLNKGQYESIKNDAIQLYPFLRDAYEQRRKKQIKE